MRPNVTELGNAMGNIFPDMDRFVDRKIELPTDAEMRQFSFQESIAVDRHDKHEIDDAVWVELHPEGGMGLRTVLARAGLIPSDSLEVKSALERGTSSYGYTEPDYKSIFLDSAVTVDLLTLASGDIKPAIAYSCDITKDGVVTNQDISYVTVSPTELTFHELADQLKHGNLDNIKAGYNAIRAFYGQDKLSYGRFKREHKDSADCLDLFGSEIISKFMIFTNHQVTTMARDYDIPWVYRVCQPADIESKSELTAADSEAIRSYQRDLESTQEAVYSSRPGPHARMDKDVYSNFTSPLWQASALVNHLIMEYVMKFGDPAEIDRDMLEDWVQQINASAGKQNDYLSLAS